MDTALSYLEHVGQGYGRLYLLEPIPVGELDDATAAGVDVADHVAHVLLRGDDVHLSYDKRWGWIRGEQKKTG